MSVVSSYISSRAPIFRINAQAVSIMDSLFAIAIGLGVRVVIDVVSHQDNRLTGTLVGLWEGVVMQHFLKKMPKSFDPYVAYGVRLFVDFLFTESLTRLVLTLVWTGMGIVLADVAPAIWIDAGLRRFWRRFRRDLYILSQSIPTIPWFARPRTVRFSPSRAASAVSSIPPSVMTTTPQAPTAILAPTPRSKRPVPGAFPRDGWETETELGSVLGLRTARSDASTNSPGTTHHRYSSLPRRRRATVETESEVSYDLDEGNVSSSDTSYTRTPTFNEADMPIIEDEEEVDTEREVVLEKGKQKEDDSTPKQKSLTLPPTPSDSALPLPQPVDEPHEVPPPTADVPVIPDDDDWENIHRNEAVHTPPPPPPPLPPKDDQTLPSRPSPPGSATVKPDKLDKTASALTPQSQPTTSALIKPDATSTADSSTIKPASTATPINVPSSHTTPLPLQTDANPWEINTTKDTTNSRSFGVKTTTAKDTQNLFDFGALERPPSYTSFPFDMEGDGANSGTKSHSTTPADDTTSPAVAAVADTTNAAAGNQDDKLVDLTSPTTPSPQENGEPSAEQSQAQAGPEGAEEQQQTSETPASPAKVDDTADNSAPEFDEDEPFPDDTSERFVKALDLRKQTIELEATLTELKRQLKAAWADDEIELGVQKQLLVDASLGKREALDRKIARWYVAACDGKVKDDPADDIQLTEYSGDGLISVQRALTSLLLKNLPRLAVTVAQAKKGGKNQKVKIESFCPLHDIKCLEGGSGRALVIELPTRAPPAAA